MKPNDIVKELQEMGSPLADMSREMPYKVPEGYFDTLSNNITSGLFEAATDTFTATKVMPFDVPQGYFDALPEQLLYAAKQQGTIADISQAMPFETPVGYFDTLPGKILQAVKETEQPIVKKTRTISLGKSLRWVAAAVLLLGIGITSYKMMIPEAVNPESELAAVPNNVINDYVAQNFTDMDPDMKETTVAANIKGLDKLNEEEIVNYLDETGWEETL